MLNLAAVLRAGPDQVVQPVGIKGRLLGSLRHVSNPLAVAVVGALFALSFDTLSQAAFFALGRHAVRWLAACAGPGAAVHAGMLLTDGINGLWIARLIRRADQTARIASRVMGLVVAGVSLLVAAFGAAKLLLPGADAWSEGRNCSLVLRWWPSLP
jgi:high-affinity nickel-transport protein